MGFKTFAALSLIPFILDQSVLASGITVDPSIATASAIAPNAVIHKDLVRGVWSIHPTAGYFNGSTSFDGAGATTTSHGFGGTAEAQFAFSDHVGMNFSGLDYSGSGDYTPGPGEPGSAGSSTVNGWLVGVGIVLDPFSGTGFRMPFFFGINYEHLSSSTPSSPTVISLTLNSPGYMFGFSPRFNLGFLRLEPFLITTTPFREGNVGCAADVVAGLCGAAAVQILPVTGVNIVFRPWGLSFYINASTSLFGTGVSFYSLGPQLTF